MNIRSLSRKLDELELLIEESNYDAVLLCEHWLPETAMKSYRLPDYNLASHFCRSVSGGGGTLIYLKSKYMYKEIAAINNLSIEKHCEVTAIEVMNPKIIIICMYRSPGGQLDLFFEKFESILDFLNQKEKILFIYGDFNIDLLSTDRDSLDFIQLLNSYGLKALVDKPTRISKMTKNSCLDNCITNQGSQSSWSLWDSYMSDHMAVTNSYKFCIKKNSSNHSNYTNLIEYRPITSNNINLCINALKNTDWSALFFNLDTDNTFNKFLETFLDIFEQHFPVKTKTCHNRNKNKSWFNNELKHHRDILNLITNFNKQNPHYNLTETIKIQKTLYKSKINKAKTTFFSNKIVNNTNKPKVIWDIIAASQNKTKSSPSHTISPDDFNKFFVNISNTISNNLQKSNIDPSQTTSKILHNNYTTFLAPETPSDVLTTLKSISNSNAKDIYGLSNRILKQLAEGIALPLSLIINSCFINGKFPSRLKTSRVVPIFKKGDENDPGNHRPISLIPVFSKPIEIGLNNRLITFLERSNLLSCHQFGFRQNKSTSDALRDLVGYVVECFERGESVMAIFCDLSKAFDCVSHQLLLNKLVHYGIRGNALQLIESYLSDRYQLVECGSRQSSALSVKAGVPQGSILGPLLFILYVNELPSIFPSLKTIQYADDTTLLDHNCQTAQLHPACISTIGKLHSWFADNDLCLNLDKTTNIIFSLSEKDDGKSFKFLGLHLESKLTWKSHITQLCKNLSSTLYLLRRINSITPLEVSRTAYMGLFQSKLSYGLIFWGGSVDSIKVFLMQKKAIRVMARLNPMESCRPHFQRFQILTLPGLYIYQCLIYIKSQIFNFATVNSRHHYLTRNGDDLLINQHRLALTHKTYIYSSIKLYNRLAPETKNLPLTLFKKRIKKLLVEMCPYSLEEFYLYL